MAFPKLVGIEPPTIIDFARRYNFNAAFVPGRVSFLSRLDAGCKENGFCGATKWQFVATNDQNCNRFSKWVLENTKSVVISSLFCKYEPVAQGQYVVSDTRCPAVYVSDCR